MPPLELPPDLPAGPTHYRRGSWWTPLVGLGLSAYLARRARHLSNLDFWRANTVRIQLQTLRRLLATAARTEFGRSHDFARLTQLPDEQLIPAYRRAVPVCDWYAYKDLIARMREGGEPDLLWPGLVRDFAQTSGTTAGDKYIPVSQEMLRSNFRASLDIFANMMRAGIALPTLLAGKALFLGGSSALTPNRHGIRTGDLSGIVTPLIRWPISEIYLPGPRIALLDHWPSKIEAMARRCLNEDVRMISGMPSWATVLAERVLQLAQERGLSSRAPGARGQPVRTLRDVWPDLTIFVHGGVRYQPFDPKVRLLWTGAADGPDLPHRLELYPASEAFVALQDTPNALDQRPEWPGLRLCADGGNFFEFVPLESINDRDPPAFDAGTVQTGQKYVVTLSTCAGLWRYILGDVVEFDTLPDGLPGTTGTSRQGTGPLRMRIVGRHRLFVNAFGENLIVEHIENAVLAAARDSGLLVGEFTAAPIYPSAGTRPALELAIEIESQPAAGVAPRLTRFAQVFDETLKAQNVDYTTKRTDSLGMAPPTITPLAKGTFHRWMDARGKLGGQHKCPRCANHRDIIDAVKAADTHT